MTTKIAASKAPALPKWKPKDGERWIDLLSEFSASIMSCTLQEAIERGESPNSVEREEALSDDVRVAARLADLALDEFRARCNGPAETVLDRRRRR